MRPAFAALVLFGAVALADGQEPKKEAPKAAPADPDAEPAKDVGPRYGINPRVKAYPQVTPKEALRSAILAIDNKDYSYLLAQLLDPKFVDGMVAERAKDFEPGALTELTQIRDFQRSNPNLVKPEDRLPFDAKGFGAVVVARARERAFTQVTKDLGRKLSDDPPAVKEMRRILRQENAFSVADPVATAAHPEIKGRSLYFRKVGERWFLENRQTDEPKKEP